MSEIPDDPADVSWLITLRGAANDALRALAKRRRNSPHTHGGPLVDHAAAGLTELLQSALTGGRGSSAVIVQSTQLRHASAHRPRSRPQPTPRPAPKSRTSDPFRDALDVDGPDLVLTCPRCGDVLDPNPGEVAHALGMAAKAFPGVRLGAGDVSAAMCGCGCFVTRSVANGIAVYLASVQLPAAEPAEPDAPGLAAATPFLRLIRPGNEGEA